MTTAVSQNGAGQLTVTDRVAMGAPPANVLRALWDASAWPRLTTHVLRVEMVRDLARMQELRMWVLTEERVLEIETRRWLDGEACIRYRQSRPPAFLRDHEGSWEVLHVGETCDVVLTHVMTPDIPATREFFGKTSDEEALRSLAEAVSRNGMRTITAIRSSLRASLAN